MRGATRVTLPSIIVPEISIHAPHAGRDLKMKMTIDAGMIFQSTRPMRGATRQHWSYF